MVSDRARLRLVFGLGFWLGLVLVCGVNIRVWARIRVSARVAVRVRILLRLLVRVRIGVDEGKR